MRCSTRASGATWRIAPSTTPAYVSRVLPALDVEGVPVLTFSAWAHETRKLALPLLDAPVTDETPSVVMRAKSHGAMLRILVDRSLVEVFAQDGERTIRFGRGVIADAFETARNEIAIRAAGLSARVPRVHLTEAGSSPS